jgi:hypothetical protein
MEKCRAKRGFFSLRDCGEMAVQQCALCGRPVCAAHLSPQSGFTRCLDCEGRQAEQTAAGQPLSDPTWSYRYRDRYYSSSRYAPIYTGSYYDSYYDRYDTRSFDSDMASRGPATAPEREGGTSWGDS